MTKGDKQKKVTMKQMCEVASKHLKKKYGIKLTPEQLWHYSPTGELDHIFFLYWEAKNITPTYE